jgi:hypothetical protein
LPETKQTVPRFRCAVLRWRAPATAGEPPLFDGRTASRPADANLLRSARRRRLSSGPWSTWRKAPTEVEKKVDYSEMTKLSFRYCGTAAGAEFRVV